MSMTDGDILGTCEDFLQLVRSSTDRADRLQAARMNRDYYRGAQWDEVTYNEYKAKGVEPITVNRCLPTINNISGLQRANRQDIRVRPRKGGKEVVANIYTELTKHALDQNDGEFVFAECFRDGLYCIESFLFGDLDEHSASEGGSLVISNRTIFNTAVDPEATEYDLNKSARFITLWDWMDKEWLEIRYPDAAGYVWSKKGDGGASRRFLSYMLGGASNTTDPAEDGDVETENRIKVFRFFWWEHVKAKRVSSTRDGSTVIVTDPDTIKKLKKVTAPGYVIKDVPGRRLHRTVICNDVLLSDDIDPYHWRTQMLPMSRFSPYWVDGMAFGVIDNIRSLNYEENVHRTNITRHLNQTVNSGWKVKEATEEAKRALEQFGSVNGLVIDESEYGGEVEKIEPNKLPSGHMTLAMQFSQDIKEVSAVNDAMHGYDTGREESGRAINMKMQQGATTTQPIFDAFDSTCRTFGNFLLRVIQNTGVYSDNEIREIIMESDLLTPEVMSRQDQELAAQIGGNLPAPTNPQALAGSPQAYMTVRPEDQARVMGEMQAGVAGASMYAQQYPALLEKWTDLIEYRSAGSLLQQLRDSRVSDYWVKVTLSPTSQTVKMANMFELSEIARMYPGIIPPDIMVGASDLSNKEEIIERLRQQPTAPVPAQVAPTGVAG